MTEEEILRKYSTPGLRRHEMTRQAKKEQLQNPKYALRPEEIEGLLNQLYPAPSAMARVTQADANADNNQCRAIKERDAA
jgi:hypothetical protein